MSEDIGRAYYKKRLNFDEYITKNMKITKEIVNDDFYAQYGINSRNQLGLYLCRAKATVDLEKLIPKEVKCVLFVRCEGTVMPKLPDTVEVLFFDKCNFKKIYFPKNLKEMYFGTSLTNKTLPDMSHLKNLWSLDIQAMIELKFLPKNLPSSLKMLTLESNRNLKSSLTSLPLNLEYIGISNCYNITKIPNLSYLKNLKRLNLYYIMKHKIIINKKTDPTIVDICGSLVYQQELQKFKKLVAPILSLKLNKKKQNLT